MHKIRKNIKIILIVYYYTTFIFYTHNQNYILILIKMETITKTEI